MVLVKMEPVMMARILLCRCGGMRRSCGCTSCDSAWIVAGSQDGCSWPRRDLGEGGQGRARRQSGAGQVAWG
jgi:hypothetical protein